MTLAIFDLDNTLLRGDSDLAWGHFLAEKGVVDGDVYRAEHDRFYAAYEAGELDIHEFLAFQLKPLSQHDRETLENLRSEFMVSKVAPMITARAQNLVEEHRCQGHRLLIVTATNSFITQPIAQAFQIPVLIATEPEIVDGRFTGRLSGVPSFREGKVQLLRQWLARHDESLAGSWFYSDSHNDLPLLEVVDHPVAVNPDEQLRKTAIRRDWPILHLDD